MEDVRAKMAKQLWPDKWAAMEQIPDGKGKRNRRRSVLKRRAERAMAKAAAGLPV